MSDYISAEDERPYPPLSFDQQDYLEVMKNEHDRGVRITIDDRQLPEDQWDTIFRVAERTPDGGNQFYMSDYVLDDNGRLEEIRFDKITVR